MERKKNELVRLTITGMTGDGNGIGKLDGYTVFIPETAIGDECEVRLVKCNKSYAFGKLEALLKPAPSRIDPECLTYRQCGGCAFRHLAYTEELSIKETVVRDAFRRLGGITAPVRPILGAPKQTGYRNKAQYPVGRDRDGQLISGFYAKRSHRIIPNRECALQPVFFAEIQEQILAFLKENHIPAYDEKTGTGLVRHIYLRHGEATGETMVCLVLTKPKLPHAEKLVAKLTAAFPTIKSIVLNHNPENTNVILGKECITLWGKDSISDLLCGVRVSLSPLAFYQVNRTQAETLYQKAIAYAGLTGEETLLDLYCGAGTIGLAAAGQVKRLIGVEIIPEAVENARQNAICNGIQNAEFFCSDAGKAAAKFAAEGIHPDVIIVDPPRKGLDQTVIDAISDMAPDRVVMVSCNPATAARDAALLEQMGYHAVEITPVDLFPRTGHVETVVLLSRKDIHE